MSLLVDEAEEVDAEAVELGAEPPQDSEEGVDNAVEFWHLSRVGGPLTVEEAWRRADELRVLREYIMRARGSAWACHSHRHDGDGDFERRGERAYKFTSRKAGRHE